MPPWYEFCTHARDIYGNSGTAAPKAMYYYGYSRSSSRSNIAYRILQPQEAIQKDLTSRTGKISIMKLNGTVLRSPPSLTSRTSQPHVRSAVAKPLWRQFRWKVTEASRAVNTCQLECAVSIQCVLHPVLQISCCKAWPDQASVERRAPADRASNCNAHRRYSSRIARLGTLVSM